jgi:hypothetical protein
MGGLAPTNGRMGIMCNFMDNGLDEELVKDSPDPVKNKKIYTRIGGSIAGEATKLVKTVKKGDGVAAWKVLENAFGNKRQLQVVREMIAVINDTRDDETMDKYLREKRDKIKDIEDACGDDYEKMWTLAKCAAVIKNVNHEKLTESLLVNIATDESKGVKLDYTALESTIQTFSDGLKLTGNGGNDEKKKDEKEKVALKADEEKPKKKWKPKGGKFGGRGGVTVTTTTKTRTRAPIVPPTPLTVVNTPTPNTTPSTSKNRTSNKSSTNPR